MRRWWLLTVVLMMGCGVDHEDICEQLSEDCAADFEIDDCVQDGQRVDDAAATGGCDDQLDTYLDCLDEDVCTWDQRCDTERAALESCAGPFPNAR
jgi:hypothetical protein